MRHETGDDVATNDTHAVVIAGGGPTGAMLACELALAGVDVVVVERRTDQGLAGVRAGGLHMRTIEIFDQRGIVDRFLSEGQTHAIVPFAGSTMDSSDMPTRHSYFVALWQIHVERILADRARELGVTTVRGTEITGFTQDDAGVDVALSEGRTLRARYLVGCDGGRSVVRKKAGIDFPGWDPTTSYLIAEIETAEEPPWGFRRTERGMNAVAKLDDGRARVVIGEPHVGQGDAPTIDDVRAALVDAFGEDFGLRRASYVSRFSDMARQAAAYRRGRVLLAGDAAHVHSPMGGQGLNLGVQDATNLGWKLAAVVHGTAPDALLDTYHAERHPVGARVLRNTLALTAMERPDDRSEALRDMMTELFRAPGPRKQYIAMTSGLDIRYDLGEGHPLLGRRMPDVEVDTADGKRRVYTFLHDARPLFLDLGAPGALAITGWSDRVRRVDARHAGAWDLPGVGEVTAPTAALVRPDGHVAWVGDGTDRGLREALTTWFGPPGPA